MDSYMEIAHLHDHFHGNFRQCLLINIFQHKIILGVKVILFLPQSLHVWPYFHQSWF